MNQWWLDCQHIYTSPSVNELTLIFKRSKKGLKGSSQYTSNDLNYMDYHDSYFNIYNWIEVSLKLDSLSWIPNVLSLRFKFLLNMMSVGHVLVHFCAHKTDYYISVWTYILIAIIWWDFIGCVPSPQQPITGYDDPNWSILKEHVFFCLFFILIFSSVEHGSKLEYSRHIKKNTWLPYSCLTAVMHEWIREVAKLLNEWIIFLYPRPTKLEGGVYWIHLVRPSVRPSIRPSVCL